MEQVQFIAALFRIITKQIFLMKIMK